MSNYLVTGAAGFIASNVCEKLLNSGHTVVGIDNLNDYYDVRLKYYRLSKLLGGRSWQIRTIPDASLYAESPVRGGNFTFHTIDIENLQDLERLFKTNSFDAVFNLAARAGVRASMENPYVFLSTNTQGTLNILECQRRFGVKKQVLASTSSLYAGCSAPFQESLPVNTPLSPYAAAKKAAELMAYSYHKLYDIDVSVVRYFTVYGPAGRPDMAPFRFIQWIKNGLPVRLFGDGSQARDFTFVDDIASGTIAAARPLGYEIINLGGGRNPISILKLISEIEKQVGREAKIEDHPFHKADIRETWADISKAKALLGWEPVVGIEEGLKVTAEWHLSNSEWVDRIVL